MIPLHGSKSRGKIKPDLISRIYGRTRLTFPLCTEPVSVKKLNMPEVLSFFLANDLVAAVCEGEEVKAGQPLALLDNVPCRPSSVSGKVKMIADAPDVQAGQLGKAVLIEPDPNTSPQVFPPLDPAKASVDVIHTRLRDTGVYFNGMQPDLHDQKPHTGPVLVLAADQEPGVCVSASLLQERTGDIDRATALIGRLCNADRVILVVAGSTIIDTDKTKTLKIPATYPESLPSMLIHRFGDPTARVFTLEYALAALDAIEQGRVRDQKCVTLIGHAGVPFENIRVMLGTRLLDIAHQCGLDLQYGDKIVTGGPMRGVAQYSLEVAVDETVDAITVVRTDDLTSFSDDPCINCGACIDVCPIRLQVQMIGRYSEFGKFDAASDLGIEHCIECGLCASVCTARRALLQLIRLAKRRLADAIKNTG